MSHALKVPLSEMFFSIEGEGILTGVPTIFIRTFGCNFTCSGFGGGNEVPNYTPIRRLDDFAAPTTGCDSAYSWHPRYKSLAQKVTVDEIVDMILKLVPLSTWAGTGLKPVISLTGGEPLLHGKFFASLLSHEFFREYVDFILVETNGSVAASDKLSSSIKEWIDLNNKHTFIWSYSPKLSSSGEPWEKAICPDVIVHNDGISKNSYFKFVSDGTDKALEEVLRAIECYEQALGRSIEPLGKLLMPMGATKEQQEKVMKAVALQCMANGFVFCARTHIWVFDNTVGT